VGVHVQILIICKKMKPNQNFKCARVPGKNGNMDVDPLPKKRQKRSVVVTVRGIIIYEW